MHNIIAPTRIAVLQASEHSSSIASISPVRGEEMEGNETAWQRGNTPKRKPTEHLAMVRHACFSEPLDGYRPRRYYVMHNENRGPSWVDKARLR